MNRHVFIALAIAIALSSSPLAAAGSGKVKHDPPGKAHGHAKHRAAPVAAIPPPAPAPVEPAAPETATPTAAPSAPAPEPRAAPAPRAPTPVPEAKVAQPGVARVYAESRATVPFAPPHAPGDEGGSVRDAWSWALPILGIVTVGAALATTRPASVRPARARPPLDERAVLSRPAALLRAGQDAVRAGRLEEAIERFTQALRLDARLAVAHFCRGVCLAALARHENAYAALRKAHRLDPQEGAYRVELSRAAARTRRHHEAMAVLAPVLQAMPELAEDLAKDESFAGMADHPLWLGMLGRL